MLFPKKTKQEQTISYPYGFRAEAINSTVLSHRALTCTLKGLIIFAAISGTLGGVISSFSLPCYPAVIFFVLFLLSMALAFMHYNKLIFNLCYPLLFLFFTYFIFHFRYQVNSGFQAFLSILQENYSDYFDLSILREAAETITNRSLTISFAAIFIGFFFLILLNIAVSEYMSLLSVILLTFPIFQLGIYIGEMPDFQYLLLLLFSYFMVGILKRSGHYLLPYRDKHPSDYSYKEKNGQLIHRYHASGKTMLQLAGIFLMLSCILGILCLPMLLSSTATTTRSTSRQKTDEIVKIFVQSGLSGFFNRYEATGGISEGKLGGVSSVRPDYETDLTVTFVPFAYETLYLKAYIGAYYTGNSWERPAYDQTILRDYFGEDMTKYESFTAFLESRRLKHYTDTHKDAGIFGKMEILNQDANANCLYLPYYTNAIDDVEYSVDQGVILGSCPVGTSYTLQYYPLLHDYWPVNETPDELIAYYGTKHPYFSYIEYYNYFNFTNYVAVPADLENYLATCKDDIGYGATTDEQIVLIQNYLRDNYTYDMAPGATPYRKDFVRYFLETQKRGYCSHFASAATMLLRSYGIPARYVEGYAVPFLEITEGSATNENYDDWFSGKNPIGTSGVVSVDVTDANAHAWVEVYKQGIGWVPYEFTPSSDESDEDTAYSDLWSLFSDLIGSRGSSNFGNNPAAQGNAPVTATRLNKLLGNTFLRPLFLFLSFSCGLALLLVTARALYRIIRLHAAYRRGDYTPLLSLHYRKLCKLLVKKGVLSEAVLLPGAFASLPCNTDKKISDIWDQNDLSAMMTLLEKCLFSEDGITKKEADTLLLFLKSYRKRL